MGTLILQHLTKKNQKQKQTKNSSTLGGTGERKSTNKTTCAAFPSC